MSKISANIGLPNIELNDDAKPLKEGATYLIFGVDSTGKLAMAVTVKAKKEEHALAIEWLTHGLVVEAHASPDIVVFPEGKTMIKLPKSLYSFGLVFYLSELTEEAVRTQSHFISNRVAERQIRELEKEQKRHSDLLKSYFTIHLHKNGEV